MPGESNLQTLLRGMSLRLSDVEFAFATLPLGHSVPPGVNPLCTFVEDEGLTIIAPLSEIASHEIEHIGGWAKISLAVHSSLSSVGLTAAISSALADKGISANVVAAYFHDHLFVQWEHRLDALNTLMLLAHDTV